MSDKEPSERIQKLLKIVVDHFDQEDRAVRERQIRQYKKLKYYWNGFQRIWWSEVAHDWRVYDSDYGGSYGASQDSSFYDKPVNVFRAYLESIIAALSVTVPSVTCYPDDADNAQDVDTARAGDKIADLVSSHNNLSLEWLHALFIYCTEGLVAAYSYPKDDYAYGSYNDEKYEEEEQETDVPTCPNCGMQLDTTPISAELQDEYMPDEPGDAEVQNLLSSNGGVLCPQCMADVVPTIQKKKVIVTRLVGTTTKPKTRICVETYGGLYVKTAAYALRQCETPYLYFSYETHYSNVLERYPDLRNNMDNHPSSSLTSGGINDPYERWGRLSTQYFGEYPNNSTTVRNCWLRPSAFQVLPELDDVKELQKLYPNGAKIVYANDVFCEAENSSLDDCWTITRNPLADNLQFDPLGLLLTSIQEITNDLLALTIQTVEHGIPQTFADPAVLNTEQYRQLEATPGQIIPTKPQPGKAVADGFYTVKTASLGSEVLPFAQKVQELGQLASGAMPSLFGGAAPNSSKTAAQYSMSRQQSLQRLGITWKMFNLWWKEIHGKVIPAFIKAVREDEKVVSKDEAGNFVNVWIRKAELQGKIGSVEIESSEELPYTWAQKKDIIMQMMQAGNPAIMAAMTAPENIPLLKKAIGLEEFEIPGEDDRQKQYEEIQRLTDTEPLPYGMNDQQQMTYMPSVEVEPLVDNHAIEADICRTWLVSAAGRLAKTENPSGYKNVLLHMQQHQQMMQAQQQMGPQQGPPPQGPQKPQAEKPQPMAQPLPQGASNAANQ